MSDICGCVKESGGGYAVRIVRGNSFTLEAAVSVYDPEDGGYAAVDLTDAEDVRLCVIGNTRVAGTDVRAAGNIVTARFSGAQGCGAYGVELTWRVGEDNFRVHEGGLFEVVNDSADATIGTSSAGGSGEGLDVSVDLRTRTLRVGKTVWVTDYNALDHRPSIGGVTLEGDRTPSELGMYSREEADALLGGKQDALVSGTSIKTVNGQSLLGEGDIETGAADALTPYDCAWVWELSQGDEAPEDKTDELIKAIEDGRNLITKYTDKDGYQIVTGVHAGYENKDNTSLTLFSSYLNSLSWILIDDSSDAYAYVVSARGVFASQEKLVSGTSIKTVNGESLLGEGDIETGADIRPLTSKEISQLLEIGIKAKGAEEMFAVSKEAYDLITALPEIGLANGSPIYKYPVTEGSGEDSITAYYVYGPAAIDDTRYVNFGVVAAAGEDGEVQYIGVPLLTESLPKSVRLTANADGTLTADTTPDYLTKFDAYLSSFPVMVVWRSVSGQVTKKNNVRCCFAQDVQTLKNEDSYYDIIKTVFLSLNGVYYKWTDYTLTPVRSAVGQTPVVYTFTAGDDGAFPDVGMDDTGRFSLIDELLFKAANPDKSNLIVKVVSGGGSLLLPDVGLSDGVITCRGYDLGSDEKVTLAVTGEGKVTVTRAAGYLTEARVRELIDNAVTAALNTEV